MSKREIALCITGFGVGLAPMVTGLCRELGWEGLVLALMIIVVIGGSVFALFAGPHQVGGDNGQD